MERKREEGKKKYVFVGLFKKLEMLRMQMGPLIAFQPARASPSTDPASGYVQPRLSTAAARGCRSLLGFSTSGVSKYNHSPLN